MPSTEFEQLETALAAGGVDAVLERLVGQLRDNRQYHELFEALKMQVRRRLGLPLLYSDLGDCLNEQQQRQLENGLIEACREVGLLLLQEGHVRDGWMYLRPVGDQQAAAAALARIQADENNLDEIVEVALHEGVDPELGFALILEHYGVCSAITTFESAMHRRSKPERRMAAGLLTQRVHADLLASLRADIARRQGAEPAETALGELIADRPWLFGDNVYHIDTTHLAATVRFARLLEDKTQLRLALDLTRYGRRLAPPFQYSGDEPFVELYPSHALYFEALLGENIEQALEYFRERAKLVDAAEHGTAAIEVYVDLLARLGRHHEAIDAAIAMTPAKAQPMGYAPSLLELSELAGDYEPLILYCRQRRDLLGFAAGLVRASRSDPA